LVGDDIKINITKITIIVTGDKSEPGMTMVCSEHLSGLEHLWI